jgi:hypothetical protein
VTDLAGLGRRGVGIVAIALAAWAVTASWMEDGRGAPARVRAGTSSVAIEPIGRVWAITSDRPAVPSHDKRIHGARPLHAVGADRPGMAPTVGLVGDLHDLVSNPSTSLLALDLASRGPPTLVVP